METIVTVTFLFVSLALIGLILIQHGKGADAGAAFGSGASSTVFGAQGAGNFLTRSTAILATAFFVLSLSLGWFAIHSETAPTLIIDETTIATVEEKTNSDLPEIPVATVEAKEKNDAALPDIPVTATETSTPDIPQ